MGAFYTDAKRKTALRHLHINPDSERVNSMQAARILSWRAKEEFGIEHKYTATAVRKHATKLDAQPDRKADGSPNLRQNTYDVKRLFEIDILPARTNAGPGPKEEEVPTL